MTDRGDVESAALAWLKNGNWRRTHGPENRDTLQHALTVLRMRRTRNGSWGGVFDDI